MRCATKAAEKEAMRLLSAGTSGSTTSEVADVSTSAASTTQPAAVTAAGARYGSSALDEYELGLIYSGASDPESDSKEAHATEESESAKLDPAKLGSDNALTRAQHIDLFGSSDEVDPSSPRQSRSVESMRGGGSVHREDDDGDAIMRHSPGVQDDQSVDASVDTNQEADDRNITRLAPQKIPWLPLQRVLRRLTDTMR